MENTRLNGVYKICSISVKIFVLLSVILCVIPNLLGIQINGREIIYSIPVLVNIVEYIKTGYGMTVLAMLLTIGIGATVVCDMIDIQSKEEVTE